MHDVLVRTMFHEAAPAGTFDGAVRPGAPCLMWNATRLAVAALGVACVGLAFALWYDGDGNDLPGWTVLLGAVGFALIIVATAVTPGHRSQVTHGSRRR